VRACFLPMNYFVGERGVQAPHEARVQGRRAREGRRGHHKTLDAGTEARPGRVRAVERVRAEGEGGRGRAGKRLVRALAALDEAVPSKR